VRTICDLYQLVALVERSREPLFVRWSQGPQWDLTDPQTSRDELTGVRLPGLSANSLSVEPWWGARPLLLWVARRLYDYRHLRDKRDGDIKAWVFSGEITGRGPDNEPLVICSKPIAWIHEDALAEAERLVDAEGDGDWGPLDRR